MFGAFAGVASALAGKGVVVQGAFSLMARVFADYRNAAIPAMVGTSREINANSDKIADAMKKVADARRRLAAIEEGDEEALTGGKTEHEKQEEKVKRHGPRRPCCPSRAAARDSRRRRFAAHVSACRPRIHAHGRRLVASKGNSWSSPILGNGK